MTPDELRIRIARWEDVHTDFKESVGSTRELAKDLVCFANTDGGQLIIGVADDRTVVGVGDIEQVLLTVDNVAYGGCSPPITVVPETVELDGTWVVVLNVAKGAERPYATSSGQYYVRSGPRCRAASREELLRLFQASTSLFFDEQPLRRLTLADVDFDLVDRYLIDTERDDLRDQPERVLRTWRLLDETTPTVAGAVLFGRRPQHTLSAAGVILGAVEGTELGGDFIDRTDLIGDFQRVVDGIQTFFSLHLRARHEVRGFQPERDDEVPLTALREAVVNAIVHRDYTIPGPSRIFVFDDRVEIRSPGRPPNSVDESAMRAGAHVPRNPHLYARVADLRLATRAGSGVPRIAKLLREASDSTLGITISDAETVLTLPRRSAIASSL